MKKSDAFILTILTSVLSLKFVSAQYSLIDSLYFLNPDNVYIALSFIISFAIIFFATSRSIFRQNKSIAAVISLAISFGIVYYLFVTGYDIRGWFSFTGISDEILYNSLIIAIIALFIFFIIKFGFLRGLGFLLLIISGLFLIGALTGLMYERGLALIIGAIMLIISIFLLSKRSKDKFLEFPVRIR